VASSHYAGGVGTYVLYFAQAPESFIVPPGDEGGPMVNGGNYPGTNSLGDLDMYSFSANAGDNIILRLGSVGYSGNLELFGPDGALLKTSGGNGTDWALTYTPTNSGNFTVVASSYYAGGVGTYVLYLDEFPEAFIVPPGDQGGPMTGDTNYTGTITLGDLDTWSFTACTGDQVSLRLNSTNFSGNIFLYGPNGTMLKNVGGNGTDWSLNYRLTNCGTFRVLVDSFYGGGSGTYGLTVNGLRENMRLCPPAISGARLTVNGIGGPAGTNFVLFSTTNVARPFGQWTPVLTNVFDKYGVLTYTNVYDPALDEEYFRFWLP
jgi:hypothetical protein